MIPRMRQRILFTFTAVLLMLTAFPAWAQNSDLSILAGISGPRGETVMKGSTATVSGSVTPSFQVNYAWQVLQRKIDLYVELPLVIPIRVSGAVIAGPGGSTESANSGPDVYFTPGLRLKFSPQARTSFYVAAGFGIASFSGTTTTASTGGVVSGGVRQNSAAFDAGAGMDFRLTRLLSLRVDGRDFITQSGLGGISGRNHGTFQAGIAFHF